MGVQRIDSCLQVVDLRFLPCDLTCLLVDQVFLTLSLTVELINLLLDLLRIGVLLLLEFS